MLEILFLNRSQEGGHIQASRDLSAMRSVNIQDVDRTSLVDLNSVTIDESLPVPERVASFLEQIKNPYCFRIGNVAVKVVYNDEGPTFQQNLIDLIKMG